MRQFVVALHRGHERVGGDVHGLRQILDRVARDDGAGVDLALEIGVGGVARREVVDGVLVFGLLLGRDVVRHAAEALGHHRQLLLPFAVEDLVRHAALLALDGVLQLLRPHVLVREALAVLVHHEVGVDADGVRAQAVRHRRVGAVLHDRAGPYGHPVAVALVHRLAFFVHAAEEHAVLRGLGRVVGEHLGVAGNVARREHHAQLRVDADDVAVLVGGVHARHPVAFFDELLALHVEAGLGPGRLRGLERAVHGPAVVGQQVHHAGEAGVVLLAPVVVLVHGAALGEHVGLLGIGGRVVVARQQFVLGGADVPVEVGTRIGDPVIQKLRVGAVAHDAHKLVDHFLRLGLLDAQLLVDLAAERAELA